MRISLTLAALSSAALMVSAPAFAHGGDSQDTVITDDGKILVSTNGACVRSKWQAGSDDCAPEPEPEPEPAPAPAPVVAPSPEPAKDARTVYFDFNSASLNVSEAAKLDALINWLTGAQGVTGATVYGFADEIGDADYNQKLSAKRAAAVEQYLASRGVVLPTNVEIVKGLGESGSLTQCDESMNRGERIKCLAADRRVEVKFEIIR